MIDRLDQIPCPEANIYKKCPEPLFHGTREWSLNVDEDTQKNFSSCCDIVLKFAKAFFEKDGSQSIIDDYQKKTKNKYSEFAGVAALSYGESKSFEYGAFYVTNNINLAIRYSQNSGGELGELAYQNTVPLLEIGIEIPNDVLAACKTIIAEYEKYKNSEPILLLLVDCNWDDLYWEKGSAFWKKQSDEPLEAQYTRNKEDIDLFFGEEADQGSFRIHNIEKYTLFAVKENLFNECKETFKSIWD